MHWLIPAGSHSVSSLGAWLGNTITPSAVLVSIVLAATQSTHFWGAFYGLFAIFFITRTCIAAVNFSYQARDAASQVRTPPSPCTIRTAGHLVANVLVAAVFVPLHKYYMQSRMSTVPWFHINRAPAGCLPVPSQTLSQPLRYGFIDALGNQLPFGIVASYAVAMAITSSKITGLGSSKGGLSATGTLVGMLSAVMTSMAAAYGLPMCDDNLEGSHETMMHVDRSSAWEERTNMTWPNQARYGTFAVLITLAATIGLVLSDVLNQKWQTVNITHTASTIPGDNKVASKPSDEKQSDTSPWKSGGQESSNGNSITSGGSMASFCSNLGVTVGVVVVMAVWSYSGSRAPRPDNKLGFAPPAGAM